MKRENGSFYSEGLQLDGEFFYDDNLEKEKPLVIICSGYTGLKSIHPERYSRFLTRKGYLCFGFDYRGFGKSEGATTRVRLEEQIIDIKNSIAFVSERAIAENRKIVLIGWGMGGGLVLGSQLPETNVSALVALNGFYDNIRTQKFVRGPEGWENFLDWFRKEKEIDSKTSTNRTYDPFDIYPLDPVSKKYVDDVLRKTEGYGLESDLTFADSLVSFQIENNLQHLKNIPLLIAHGKENALHPPIEAESLYQKYPGPKELLWIENAGHTEWMLDDNPIFIHFADRLEQWIQKTLA